MTKTRKITLLYNKAHGAGMDATAEEKRELKKYQVSSADGNYATKANITEYVNAVDNGYYLSFYDWCQNNLKADRRRRGSSTQEMAANNRDMSIGVVLIGWLTWGMAVYWLFKGSLSVGKSAVAGAVISVILAHMNRRMAGFTLFLLPIILTVVFGR